MMSPGTARRTLRGGASSDAQIADAVMTLKHSARPCDRDLVAVAARRLASRAQNVMLGMPEQDRRAASDRMARNFEQMNAEPLFLQRVSEWLWLGAALFAAGLLLGTLPAAFADARMSAETFVGY